MANSGELIRTELDAAAHRLGLVKEDQFNVKIICPFHDDHNPSLSIVVEEGHPKFKVGFFKCRSCGEVGGWNKLAAKIGSKSLSGSKDHPDTAERLFTESTDQNLLMDSDDPANVGKGVLKRGWPKPKQNDSVPWLEKDEWRGISGKVLVRVDARAAFPTTAKGMMLYLPCHVHGKHIGGIYCILERQSKKDKAYINTVGDWAERALYPFDYVRRMLRKLRLRTVVIVEGPRDALRLIQHGIPALALIGAGNVSMRKVDLLFGLNIDRVVLATDPDEAGESAVRKLKKELREHVELGWFKFRPEKKNEEGVVIREKEDPGNMSKKRVAQLREFVFQTKPNVKTSEKKVA